MALAMAWLQVQLIPRLEDEPPIGLIKALLFFAKLGPGHVEMFERVSLNSHTLPINSSMGISSDTTAQHARTSTLCMA